MDQAGRDTGISFKLTENWRALTAYGVASVGLACGVAQPALAEWWKSQSAKAATSATRPVQAENGFAATIRRLMSESRRASDQGDHAKAIQLAERAAKISEASSQLLGSTPDCSPRETERFLAETRLRSEPKNVAAAQPAPANPTGPVIVPASPITQPAPSSVAAVQPSTVPDRKQQQTQPVAQAAGPSAAGPSVPGSSAPPEAAEAHFETVESPLFGERIAGTRPGRSSTKPAKSAARTLASPVPPSPSEATTDVDDLLAQSRVAAADGDFNRAIALAELAVAESNPTTLFGPARQSNDTPANRWLKTLQTQQNSPPIVRSQEIGFESPVAIVLKDRSADVASTNTAEQISPASPPADSANSVDEPVAGGFSTVIQAQLPNPEVEPTTSVISADAELWSEDLPPAPANEVKRAHQRFSRSTLSHGSEWIDADALDSAQTDTPNDLRASADNATSSQVSPSTADNADNSAADNSVPEFPLGTVSTPGFSALEPGDSIVAAPAVSNPRAGQETKSVEGTHPRQSLVPLRHRGDIQQVSAELPNSDSTLPKNKWRPAADVSVGGSTEDSVGKAKLETPDTVRTSKSTETSQPPVNEVPVQRFPIQRVLQLQQRLEAETAKHAIPAQAAQTTYQSQPSPRETPPRIGPLVPADWFIAPELNQTPQQHQREQEATVVPRSESAKLVEFAKKPVLKLRERPPTLIDEMVTATDATVAPRVPAAPRRQSVGVSMSSPWTSIDSSESPAITERDQSPRMETSTAAEQPELAPPVSQVAFESTDGDRLTSPAKTPSPSLVIPEAASPPAIAPPPPVLPSESPWYRDAASPEKPPVAEVVVRKNGFAMVDQLAESLRMPIATLIALMGAGGLGLFGLGLMVLRVTIRRRYN